MPANTNLASNDAYPKTAVLQESGGIGDFVMHLPYFRAAAAHSRRGKVSVIARPSTLAKDLVSHESWVEEIIDYDCLRRDIDGGKALHAGLAGTWRMARELRARHFERILLFTNHSKCGLLAWLARIPRRAGYGFGFRPNRINRLFLNEGPYIKRHDKRNCDGYWNATHFAIAHGLCAAPIVPRVTVPDEHIQKMRNRLATLPRPFCALVIGSTIMRDGSKQWGVANFSALASELITRGDGVLLLGGPAETHMARSIENAIPAAQRRSITSLTQGTLLETAAALSLARLCVGNDTGATHLAAACGRPAYMVLRPPNLFDHDPLLHLITAPSLDAISTDCVLARITGELRNEN